MMITVNSLKANTDWKHPKGIYRIIYCTEPSTNVIPGTLHQEMTVSVLIYGDYIKTVKIYRA